MRLTTNIIIFTFCISFVIFLMQALGIGGTIESFWDSLKDKILIGGVVGIGIIIAALIMSGTEIKLIFAGGTVGNRVGEAAAIGAFEIFYGICAWQLADFFYNISVIGPYIGAFLGVILLVILFVDVVDRVTSMGG